MMISYKLVIALLAGLFLAGCDRSAEVRYRVTVEVKDQGKIRSAHGATDKISNGALTLNNNDSDGALLDNSTVSRATGTAAEWSRRFAA